MEFFSQMAYLPPQQQQQQQQQPPPPLLRISQKNGLILWNIFVSFLGDLGALFEINKVWGIGKTPPPMLEKIPKYYWNFEFWVVLVIIYFVLSNFDYVAKFTVKKLNKDIINRGQGGSPFYETIS